MPYRVVLTDRAETDIESVVQWFHEQNAKSAAIRWVNDLFAKLATLETNPDRCSLAAESQQIGEPIRELLFGRRRYKYRLLFRTAGNTVEILRVRHSSRGAITRDDI